MQAVLAPPGFGEVVSLLGYILSHPHLFIGSTTVMTTGLVIGVGLTAAFAAVGAPASATFAAMAGRVLFWLAPKLALALAWFGVGSMILATEILLRFHHLFPEGTEMQFRSGLGHLVVAAIGILLLRSRLVGRSRSEWVEAHFWALTYMSVHVVLLTPPWFDFMFQGELVRTVANSGLALALAVNVYFWRSARRSPKASTAL
jgi:hypothetical protein